MLFAGGADATSVVGVCGRNIANARAAQRMIKRHHPGGADLKEILDDIADDDRRAGEVIARLRALRLPGFVRNSAAQTALFRVWFIMGR